MQPLCSLQLRPSPSLGTQVSTASFQQLEEKQLFEKFWKGTFKAVATPRPESIIVASITAQRRVINTETTVCQPLKTDEGKVADTRLDAVNRNGKGKGRKHHSHRRARSSSYDEDLDLRPKAKKKKRKSERKRKRKRSPSHSLSPPRKKKKKKKKKSSKKSKRHRYTSKKSKHSSSSLRHKRKDERKHKKSSRTHSRRKRRYRRSESYSSSCHSSTEDRNHLQKSVVHQDLGDRVAVGEKTNGVQSHVDMKWRPAATKSVCKTAPKYRSILSTSTILLSKPGSELLHEKGSQPLSIQTDGSHDYDSGNDTSSPPSSKTGVSQASVTENKRNVETCQGLASPEKLKLTDRDNASDSGNSVTSYASLCKPYKDDSLSATLFSGNSKREQITLGCQVEVVRPPKTSSCSRKMRASPRQRLKTRSFSSRSRSRSSESSRYSGRYSRSLSLSSCRSYSTSCSADLRRRGSVASLSSRGSYSRYSTDRLQHRKRAGSYRETDVKYTRKVSGKRQRRKSYSPMKKRRRDSPSHLEARRITSARKRPIPYFRPSPSSSSRCTSMSSWSSLLTRSRSRSQIHSIKRSRSRSRSRSPSYSSYRSYSRSSSFISIFGTRSRSRSCGSLSKRNKTRH